ncbi:MAG: tetratricopeptide repeat protein [Planctomycetes bacterium]|nr:tetratricopeptide repeat protein [Planctomycetota bacterium]MCB9916780.1 tetratricopeptide repeat protein [Planctomycetota bacterium]
MTTQTASAPIAPLSSPWILGPVRDLVLFVATPILIFVAITALQRGVASKDIEYFVLAFGAMGHNLPGMMRAYGDRDLFQRFKVRFVVAPIAIFATCFAFAWHGSTAIILIAYLWAVWHALMQIFGFLRIYDAKVGAVHRVHARVDFAMCIAWFGGAVFFSDSRLHLIQSNVARFGIAPFGAETLQVLRYVAGGAIALTTLCYAWNQISRRRAGQRISHIKNLLYVTSIGFWWYAHVYIADVMLGLIMFEIFHDVQYLGIVWLFNRKRVESGTPVGSLTRFLFRNSWGMVFLYIGLCMSYGGFIPASGSFTATPLAAALAATVIQSSGILHYYYDGFIWKVRESSIRKGLGVDASNGAADSIVNWHAAKWMLLVIPAAAMWIAGEREPSVAMAESLVASTPDAPDAQFELAVKLNEERRHLESLPHFERALAKLPGDGEIETNLAMARLQAGKDELRNGHDDAARELITRASATTPGLASQTVQRGLELWQEKKFDDAIVHLRAALFMNDRDPIAHLNLALAYRDAGDRTRALRHARAGASMRPGDAKAQALVAELSRP